jgi:hypothetical protein
MTPTEIMRDLARDDIFPKTAMTEAGARREEMAPVFINLVTRLAHQRIPVMKDADLMAFIPIFHMLWTEALTKTPDKPGRNDPCPFGSGKKFKKCCLN